MSPLYAFSFLDFGTADSVSVSPNLADDHFKVPEPTGQILNDEALAVMFRGISPFCPDCSKDRQLINRYVYWGRPAVGICGRGGKHTDVSLVFGTFHFICRGCLQPAFPLLSHLMTEPFRATLFLALQFEPKACRVACID